MVCAWTESGRVVMACSQPIVERTVVARRLIARSGDGRLPTRTNTAVMRSGVGVGAGRKRTAPPPSSKAPSATRAYRWRGT